MKEQNTWGNIRIVAGDDPFSQKSFIVHAQVSLIRRQTPSRRAGRQSPCRMSKYPPPSVPKFVPLQPCGTEHANKWPQLVATTLLGWKMINCNWDPLS